MEQPGDIVWTVEIGDGKSISIERDGAMVMLIPKHSSAPPICLTRDEALAVSEGLRRQAELISPESN